MSNHQWSQCDALPIRDLPDSSTGAATEGQDKVNCRAFVENAHRLKMQKNCFLCRVHHGKVTNVFSSAGQLAEKLPCRSPPHRSFLVEVGRRSAGGPARQKRELCLRGCRGREHGCGASSVLRVNYGGKGHREIRRRAGRSSFWKPRSSTSEGSVSRNRKFWFAITGCINHQGPEHEVFIFSY